MKRLFAILVAPTLLVPGGGPFENVFVAVWLTDGDRVCRIEIFDLDAAGRAVARFEELCAARTP